MPDPSNTSATESFADEPTHKLSRLLWWLQPKIALPLLLFAIILLSPLMYRAQRINSVPVIPDPFDIDSFGTVDIAPADNAMTQYAVAVGMYLDAGFKSIPEDDKEFSIQLGWKHTSESLRKHLAANEPALAEWRKGTERAQSVVVQPKDMTMEMRLDVIQNLRGMSLLAFLKADQCLSEGDIESAWGWHRAAIRCSRHVAQNGVVIQWYVRDIFFQQAAKGIIRWAEDPRVTAAQLRAAIDDLHAADQLATPLSDALKCEYLVLRNWLRQDRMEDVVYISGGRPAPQWRSQSFLLGDPEYSKRILRHAFDNWLSEIDKPRWQQAPPDAGNFGLFEIPAGKRASLPPREIQARIMSECRAKRLLPAIGQWNEAQQRAAAREAALKLALACQTYHRLHGDWPAKLDDLTPNILSELPADPLGKTGETFLMKRDSDELIIYSVGWDGADDGGQVDSSGSHRADEGYRLKRPTKRTPASD